MSEFDDIKKLWKKADNQISAHESLDADAIYQAIASQSLGITSKLLKSIRSGILFLSISVTLFGYNVYGYAGNDFIVTLCISCLVLSSILLTYLFFQHIQFGSIDQASLSLRDILMSKIKYFKRSLYLVHHAMAMAIVLLVIGLNLVADNDGGTYYVGNMWLYIGINIIAYVSMIIILRLSHGLYLKQYENALGDLEETKLTEIRAEIRKHRWIRHLLITIALLVAVVGLVVFYMKVSG
jgi:hypothetical protein